MKGTEHFKQTIKAFLDKKAASDELFAQNYSKPDKNLDDCITYYDKRTFMRKIRFFLIFSL